MNINDKVLVRDNSGLFVPPRLAKPKEPEKPAFPSWKRVRDFKILCDECQVEVYVPKRDRPHVTHALCSNCVRRADAIKRGAEETRKAEEAARSNSL